MQIADKMMVSNKTVFAHKYMAMKKFNLSSDYELLLLLNKMAEKNDWPNVFHERINNIKGWCAVASFYVSGHYIIPFWGMAPGSWHLAAEPGGNPACIIVIAVYQDPINRRPLCGFKSGWYSLRHPCRSLHLPQRAAVIFRKGWQQNIAQSCRWVPPLTVTVISGMSLSRDI